MSEKVLEADVAGGEAHLLQQGALDQRQQLAAAVQVFGQAMRADTVYLQVRMLCWHQPRLCKQGAQYVRRPLSCILSQSPSYRTPGGSRACHGHCLFVLPKNSVRAGPTSPEQCLCGACREQVLQSQELHSTYTPGRGRVANCCNVW